MRVSSKLVKEDMGVIRLSMWEEAIAFYKRGFEYFREKWGKNRRRDKGEIKKDECSDNRQEIKILQKADRIKKEE